MLDLIDKIPRDADFVMGCSPTLGASIHDIAADVGLLGGPTMILLAAVSPWSRGSSAGAERAGRWRSLAARL